MRDGTSLKLTLTIQFGSAFAGPKTIYTRAIDWVGLSSGWSARGAWTVPQSGAPSNLSLTMTPVAGSVYDVQATVRNVGGRAEDISQVWARLGRALPGQGFDCLLIAEPVPGVLYLADDLGDWGPNPNDRYINGQTLQPNGAIDWPNNSQCTLRGAGSTITMSGELLTVNFRVELKPHLRGYLDLTLLSKSGATWSAPADFGSYWLGLPSEGVTILPTGFQSAGGTITVGATSGRREVFFLPFDVPYGAQNLVGAALNVTPNSSTDGNGIGNCKITISPIVEVIWLDDVPNLALPSSAFVDDPSHPVLLENYQCKVYSQTSRVQFLSPTQVMVRLDIEFKANWTGLRYLHRGAANAAGQFVWQNPGNATYNVQYLPAPPLGEATTLQQLKDCLKDTNRAVCQLAPGTYDVDEEWDPVVQRVEALVIRRSNLTVRGRSKHETILRRKRTDTNPDAVFALQEPILKFDSTAAVGYSNVVISDLTFDGNRTGQEMYEPKTLPGNVGLLYDLMIVNVNGSTAGQPGVTIENCRFINAPNGAIASQPAYQAGLPAGTLTKGIVIRNNEFRRSVRAPIHIGLNKLWYPQTPTSPPSDWGGACDTFLPDETVQDVLIEKNFFEHNDTGAFGVHTLKDLKIRNNVMLDNYNNGWDCAGGVIAVGSCAKSSNILVPNEITDNFLWNRNVFIESTDCRMGLPTNPPTRFAKASGIEFWGTDLLVSGNRIEYTPTEAIGAYAVQRLKVQNNKIRNASRGFQFGPADTDEDYAGIQIANCTGEDSAYRPVDDVKIRDTPCCNEIGNVTTASTDTILGQTIYQPYAVKVKQDHCEPTRPDTMTNIMVELNGANPRNKSRQQLVCRAPGVSGVPPDLSVESLVLCLPDLRMFPGSSCTTAGCP